MNKNQQALLYRIVAAQLKAAFDAADQLPRCRNFYFNYSTTPRVCFHLFGRKDLDLIAPRHLWRWKDNSSPDYPDEIYPITYYVDAWGVRFEILGMRTRWSDRDRIARWKEQINFNNEEA